MPFLVSPVVQIPTSRQALYRASVDVWTLLCSLLWETKLSLWCYRLVRTRRLIGRRPAAICSMGCSLAATVCALLCVYCFTLCFSCYLHIHTVFHCALPMRRVYFVVWLLSQVLRHREVETGRVTIAYEMYAPLRLYLLAPETMVPSGTFGLRGRVCGTSHLRRDSSLLHRIALQLPNSQSI